MWLNRCKFSWRFFWPRLALILLKGNGLRGLQPCPDHILVHGGASHTAVARPLACRQQSTVKGQLLYPKVWPLHGFEYTSKAIPALSPLICPGASLGLSLLLWSSVQAWSPGRSSVSGSGVSEHSPGATISPPSPGEKQQTELGHPPGLRGPWSDGCSV